MNPKLKNALAGLPWWLSGKESTCQCRRHGFNPWSRKIPQAAEQLSSSTTTVGPVLSSPGNLTIKPTYSHARKPVLCKKKSHRSKKPSQCNEE